MGFCAYEDEHTSHIITSYNSCSNAHVVLCCMGVCCHHPHFGRKGVRKMMNSEQYREHIERTFNAFCKIVLYHAALAAARNGGIRR